MTLPAPELAHLPAQERRKILQRKYRAEWKARNAERYRETERERQRQKYAVDEAHAQKLRGKSIAAYAADPVPVKERTKAFRAANSGKLRSYWAGYREANRERIAIYKTQWLQANRDSVNSRNSARRSGTTHATPVWADKEAIKAIYAEARSLNMHVDHIVPLNGETVCGLHVENNLQLLPPVENIRKGNRHAS